MASGDGSSREGFKISLKSDLLDAISRLQPPLAVSSELREMPPPLPYVQGVGDIQTPISAAQAQALISAAHSLNSPNDVNTGTTPAPNPVGRLDPTQFILRGPEWPEFIKRLCAQVLREVDITGSIKAELREMVIFQPGSSSVPHNLSITPGPSYFGNLEITLPPYPVGGEIVLKHDWRKETLRPYPNTQSFIFRFSDVSQEVRPLRSGYRCVLVYSLKCLEVPMPVSCYSQFLERRKLRATQDLRDALQRWTSQSQETRERNFVYHVLDQGSISPKLTLETLSRESYDEVQVLKELARDIPLELFLVTLNKHEITNEYDGYDSYLRNYEEGDDEEEDDDELNDNPPFNDEFETSFSVKHVRDMEGRLITDFLDLKLEDVLQDNCFEGVEGFEEYSGYTQDEEDRMVCDYSLTALAIVARDSVSRFVGHKFFRFDHRYDSARLRYLAEASARLPGNDSLISDLERMCKGVWNGNRTIDVFGRPVPKPTIEAESTSYSFKTLIEMERYQSFNEISGYHQGMLPTNFFVWVQQWVLNSQEESQSKFSKISSGLSSAVQAYSSFTHLFKAVSSFAPLENGIVTSEPQPDYIIHWAREQYVSHFRGCGYWDVSKNDISAIVDSSLYFEPPSEFFFDTVVPTVSQRPDAPAFLVALVVAIWQQHASGKVEKRNYFELCRRIVTLVNNSVDFSAVHPQFETVSEPQRELPHKISAKPPPVTRPAGVNREELVQFFSAILDVASDDNTDDLVVPLISKLISTVPRILAHQLNNFWVPFLQLLIPVLHSHNILLSTGYYQHLYLIVFRYYITGFVGPEPPIDTNLVRQAVGCVCTDCVNLSTFLTHPGLRVTNFRINGDRRKHLIQQIEIAGIEVSHQIVKMSFPYALLVTKTFEASERLRREWKQRLTQASENIRAFSPIDLNILLGEQEHSNLLRAVGHFAETVIQTPVAGSKRRSEGEVIDLT